MGSIPSNVSSARLMCGANPHPHSNKLKKGDLNWIENIQYTRLSMMVDAQGRYVMPGLIEPHMHVMAPFNNTIDILDFYTASICAAFGGVTTFMDFSTTTKEVPVLQAVEERKAERSMLMYL